MSQPRPPHVPRLATGLAAAVALVGMTACGGDVSGPGDGAGANRVSFSVVFTGSEGGSSAARSPAFSVTQTDGSGNEIVLDRVALVLSEIELEADDFECPEEDETGEDEAEDDCEELERGPMLVDVEPGSDPIQQDLVVQEIPARFVGATFTELEFEIEVPEEEDGADPGEFLGAGVSVLVEGTYNGEAFSYTSDLEAEQERSISVEVTEGNPETNVTLEVALDGWFRADDGTLVDPDTAGEGGENEDLVEENIEASFDAFEDEDEDGVDEDEEEDEDEAGDDEDGDGDDEDDG